MTADEARALAETRNASPAAGRLFAREQAGTWGVARIATPFGQPPMAHTGQEPKRGSGPQPAPSMPGLVTPWNAGA